MLNQLLFLSTLSLALAFPAAQTTSAAATTGPTIELEYYKDFTCGNRKLSAVTLTPSSTTCVELTHAAGSFHIGGPNSTAQVPANCTFTGYADMLCEDGVSIELTGTANGTCYRTYVPAGKRGRVVSVSYSCSG